MLHGIELAQRLVVRIVQAKAAEQALVLQMPGWASRTPTVPFAVAVTRGPLFHILAAVEVWKVIVAPPPALARLARRIEWSDEGPDEAAIGDALAALSTAWWTEAPEAVGAFDVAGSITHALTNALGAARGPFGNVTYCDPGRGGAELLARCGLGRDGTSPRWPELANVTTEPDEISVTLTGANGTRESSALHDVHELAAALPNIVATLSATDEACAAWLTSLAAMRGRAEELRGGLPGSWTMMDPYEIDLTRPAAIVLQTTAKVGGHMGIQVSAHGDGASVAVGKQTFELRPDMLASITQAIAAESRLVRASRLVEGERYRVLRGFGGAMPGEVLLFAEVIEVRPSGADVWCFRREGPGGAITLSSDSAADREVLDSLEDFLAG